MLKYIVIDVDGTLTDGGVYYDNTGNEFKKFSTKDGTGFVCARAAGIKLIVLTGRKSASTERRMMELKAEKVFQSINDKVSFLQQWMVENGVRKEDIGYIGDDINDLAPMSLCGYIGCPSDACDEVKRKSDYVSAISGGHGAVRDVIEHYLKEIGRWDEVVASAFGTGI